MYPEIVTSIIQEMGLQIAFQERNGVPSAVIYKNKHLILQIGPPVKCNKEQMGELVLDLMSTWVEPGDA